jgi:hypothetical protein
MCSDLLWNGVKVEIMWIPSHVGPLVDKRARHMLLNGPGPVLDRPLPSGKICLRSGTLQILVDSLTPHSRKFFFHHGLRVKGRTGNWFKLYQE